MITIVPIGSMERHPHGVDIGYPAQGKGET